MSKFWHHQLQMGRLSFIEFWQPAKHYWKLWCSIFYHWTWYCPRNPFVTASIKLWGYRKKKQCSEYFFLNTLPSLICFETYYWGLSFFTYVHAQEKGVLFLNSQPHYQQLTILMNICMVRKWIQPYFWAHIRIHYFAICYFRSCFINLSIKNDIKIALLQATNMHLVFYQYCFYRLIWPLGI